MTYNELYLLILGSIALISAGVILLTIDKTAKYRLDTDKHKKRCKES